jgi:hypothetical protein
VYDVAKAEALLAYITNQAEHHRKYSFQEEVRELLKQHRITFDELEPVAK